MIVRAGFDVPLQKNIHTEAWEAADETRIKESLPTLGYLIEEGARIIIVSHLNRPKGWEEDKSLWPVAVELGKLLALKVVRVRDKLPDYDVPHLYFLTSNIMDKDLSELSRKMKPGEILFLENARFYKEEEGNDPAFIKRLAAFGDLYVNDAFSVSHRKEASVFGLAQTLPAYAGLSLLQDLRALGRVARNPKKPLVVLMGGAKIADKIETIHNLAKTAQHVLIGGALANSFLKAKGYEVGKSKTVDEHLAQELLRDYKDKLVLPSDVVVARSAEDLAHVVMVDKIKPTEAIIDIGPETIRKFSTYIKQAQTLVWNGPLGMIEKKPFDFGSLSLSRIFAARSKGHAFGVAGGGETAEVIDRAKVAEYIDHISTGGGAMLEFLAGKSLPGIKVLERN